MLHLGLSVSASQTQANQLLTSLKGGKLSVVVVAAVTCTELLAGGETAHCREPAPQDGAAPGFAVGVALVSQISK